MEHGNGTKTYITDGNAHSSNTATGQLGRPPQIVGTPGTLLAPDRYCLFLSQYMIKFYLDYSA